MLVGMIAVLVPAILAVGLQLDNCIGYFFTVEGIVLLATALLYTAISKKELITIQK